jgi:hypothetical protein
MATGCTLPPLEFQGQNRKLVTTFFGGTLTALGYVIDTRRGGATLHLPSKTSQVLSIRTGHATSRCAAVFRAPGSFAAVGAVSAKASTGAVPAIEQREWRGCAIG